MAYNRQNLSIVDANSSSNTTDLSSSEAPTMAWLPVDGSCTLWERAAHVDCARERRRATLFNYIVESQRTFLVLLFVLNRHPQRMTDLPVQQKTQTGGLSKRPYVERRAGLSRAKLRQRIELLGSFLMGIPQQRDWCHLKMLPADCATRLVAHLPGRGRRRRGRRRGQRRRQDRGRGSPFLLKQATFRTNVRL
jgi:hypothetical protein